MVCIIGACNTHEKSPTILGIVMRNFILIYIALRTFLAVFYGVNIVAGLNILELVGFLFPIILLLYWAMEGFRTVRNKYEKIYVFIITWVLLVTLLKMLSYGFGGIESLSGFFRVLNGFAVFVVFPLIFKDQKSINGLLNAFFITTLFPLLQGLIQLLLGADIGGMRTSIIAGHGMELSYYGLYHKTGVYAWAAICGALIIVYKMPLANKINKKRVCFWGLFFLLYLILASLTLSRTIIASMLVVSITMVIAITGEKAWLQKIITILIMFLLAFVVSESEFAKDRYEQIMKRTEAEFQVVSGERDFEGALHGRVGLWKNKLEQFNEKPLIDRLIGTNINIGPHSDYVIWVLQYGYIGIILYIMLFFGLLLSSIRTLSRINRIGNSYLWPYGLMVIAGLVIWLMEAIIHNSSKMPDYSYFIIGNTAIFLSMGKCCNGYPKRQKDYNLYGSYASTLYGAEYCNSNNP